MNKKIRDYLFILFIVCFILGTTIVSLYASGYKLNLGWPPKFNRFLIKTGIISLKTSPSGATIYLNNKPQSNFSINPWEKAYLTTDTKLKNILPGEYDLTLERANYWPLTKKIQVYSGQTTFIEDINLFRSDVPLLIASTTLSDLKLSMNRKYLYLPTEKKIITLKNGSERILPYSGTTTGEWLINSDQIMLNGSLFGSDISKDINYGQLIGADADKWYLDENSQNLYFVNKNSIGFFNTVNKTSSLILSGENYITYELRGEILYIVTENNGHLNLIKYSLKNQKIVQKINLPVVANYTFSHDNEAWLTLYDDKNHTLYLFDTNNLFINSKVFKNVFSWQWLNPETLAYNNNWEIYIYNLKEGNASLLTRFGEEITKIIWNKNNNYLILATANNLYAYDLKFGINTRILQTDKINSPILDEKNDTLYFWSKIGNTTGVYKLLIQ